MPPGLQKEFLRRWSLRLPEPWSFCFHQTNKPLTKNIVVLLVRVEEVTMVGEITTYTGIEFHELMQDC